MAAADWLAQSGDWTRVIPAVVYGGDQIRGSQHLALRWKQLADASWASPEPSLG